MTFAFDLLPDEPISDRIVRCAHAALDAGPMGETARHDDYRSFIAANQEDDAGAEAMTHVRTSCAIFVRALRLWCGGTYGQGHYVPGTPMFESMGVPLGFHDPAFVPLSIGASPEVGDIFYMAPTETSPRGHTGIFVEDRGDGVWETAEGGLDDGTVCRLRTRTLRGDHFTDDGERVVFGWFRADGLGLPPSPSSAGGGVAAESSAGEPAAAESSTGEPAAAETSTAAAADESVTGATVATVVTLAVVVILAQQFLRREPLPPPAVVPSERPRAVARQRKLVRAGGAVFGPRPGYAS
jgi:hypothetical protein